MAECWNPHLTSILHHKDKEKKWTFTFANLTGTLEIFQSPSSLLSSPRSSDARAPLFSEAEKCPSEAETQTFGTAKAFRDHIQPPFTTGKLRPKAE